MTNDMNLSNEEYYVYKMMCEDTTYILNNRCVVDWNILLNILVEQTIFLQIYPDIKEIIPFEYKEKYEEIYRININEINEYVSELLLINEQLNSYAIEAVYIKGLFLSEIIYNNLYSRKFGDIDILVKKDDMQRAYDALYEIGYRFLAGTDQNSGMVDVIEKPEALFRKDHFEYPCVKCKENGMEISIEIKFASSAIEYDYIKDFMVNTRMLQVGHIKVHTLNEEYTLLHILANIYVNVESDNGVFTGQYLRDFIDLKVYLKKYDVDWENILRLSKKYNLTYKIYTVLKYLNCIFEGVVQNDVVKMFGEDIKRKEGVLWKSNNVVERCFHNEKRLDEYFNYNKLSIFRNVKLSNSDIISCSKLEILHDSNIVTCDIVNSAICDGKYFNIMVLYDYSYFKENKLFLYLSFINNDYIEKYIDKKIIIDDDIEWHNINGYSKNISLKDYRVCILGIEAGMAYTHESDMVYLTFEVRKKVGKIGFCTLEPKMNSYILRKENGQIV